MHLILWSLLFSYVSSNNFYTHQYTGPEGSRFGYAIELRNTSSSGGQVLVGAPGLDDHAGGVFICKLTENTCQKLFMKERMPLSATGTTSRQANQWLGSSITALNDSLVICAPRWTRQIHTFIFMNGICYWLRDEMELQLAPLAQINKQGYSHGVYKYYFYAYGQLGLSAHFTSSGELLLGTPGLLNWKGSVISYANSSVEPNFTNPIDIEELSFFSYMGYSLDSSENLIATGVPRGNSLTGQVFLYRDNILDTVFSGGQLGEYFGASVTIGDINGDGKDDVIVGAPMYSNNNLEVGRIHLYFTGDDLFYKHKILEGKYPKGRFGTALQIVGDINGDGLSDLLVTAPYQNERSGVVYLYTGDKETGLKNEPLYTISGKELGAGSEIGCSVSRALDIDGNNISDIAVGACGNNKAMVILHRPFIRVITKLSANVTTLSLDTKPKTLNISACLTYTGQNSLKNLSFIITVENDKYEKRINESTVQFILECEIEETCCHNFIVQLNGGEKATRKYTEPLNLIMNQSIVACEPDPHCPVEDTDNDERTAEIQIPFETDCGEDGICQPELNLETKWLGDDIVIGKKSSVELHLSATNTGESAFLCEMAIEIESPEKFRFASLPERCRLPTYTQRIMLCHLGNPFTSESSVSIYSFYI